MTTHPSSQLLAALRVRDGRRTLDSTKAYSRGPLYQGILACPALAVAACTGGKICM